MTAQDASQDQPASEAEARTPGRATVRARVIVYPRPEVLDPQGRAIRDALARVGFGEVADLRVGKCFDLALTAEGADRARERVREMCDRLLANPLIERYEIELRGEEGVPP